MRQSRKLWVILTASTLIGLTFYILRPRHPTYEGKTLEEWMLTNRVPPEAVKTIGLACIPVALRILKAEPPKFPEWLDRGFVKQWRHRRMAKLGKMQDRTFDVFAALGTNGVSAIDDLVKIVEASSNPGLQTYAAACLAPMGERGVKALGSLLGHSNKSVRIAAASACFRVAFSMEAHARIATPYLLQCVTGHGYPENILSLRALGSLSDSIDWAPSFDEILVHSNVTNNPNTLHAVLQTVARFGQRAAVTSNAVSQFLSHPDRTVARQASNTLDSLRHRP